MSDMNKRRVVKFPFTKEQKKSAFVSMETSRARRNTDKLKGITLNGK